MIKHTKNWFSLSGSIALVAALLTSTAVLGQTVSNSSGFRIEINTPAKYEERKLKNLRYSPKQQRQAYSFDDPVRIIVRFKSRWRPEGQLGTHAERIRQRNRRCGRRHARPMCRYLDHALSRSSPRQHIYLRCQMYGLWFQHKQNTRPTSKPIKQWRLDVSSTILFLFGRSIHKREGVDTLYLTQPKSNPQNPKKIPVKTAIRGFYPDKR